jgi:CrcB protein
VAIAGAVGALARYGLDLEFRRDPQHVPWITLAINVSGSFALGFVVARLDAHPLRESWLRPTITIGLLGAYTTFSTLSLEHIV